MQLIRKLVTPSNSFKVNNTQQNELKVPTNTVHASVKKIIPKETSKTPIL